MQATGEKTKKSKSREEYIVAAIKIQRKQREREAKEEEIRVAAEKAKEEEEIRVAAEKAKEEEIRVAAEKAEEEARQKAAERSRREAEKERAAKARKAEATEKKRLEKEEEKERAAKAKAEAAEKKRLEKEAKEQAEKARKAEEGVDPTEEMIKEFVEELSRPEGTEFKDDDEKELVKRILASIKLDYLYEGETYGCYALLTKFTSKLSEHTTMRSWSKTDLYGLSDIFKEQNKHADRNKRKGESDEGLLFSQDLIEKTEEFAKEITAKLEPSDNMKELLSDLDKNIIDNCGLRPVHDSNDESDEDYTRYWGHSPQMKTPQFTKTEYYNYLLNRLKGKNDDGCPAEKFVNDKNNISSYEQLCSDSDEKKEKARKYRMKALVSLHPDKNTRCNEESKAITHAITQILTDSGCTRE